MKWAVEIQKSSLEQRNLVDLLQGLGFELVEGVDFKAVYSPYFDSLETAAEVWNEGKKIRDAFTGSAAIDPEFVLGSVIDYSSDELRRHAFLEVEPIRMRMSVGSVTLKVSPPSNLSEDELKKWEEKRAEADYLEKLERQREKLEPVFQEPKASKVLKALAEEDHTGETLYKMYETMEGHPSNRRDFQLQFGISKHEFKRFGDAVHNPAVSGDLARHAYEHKTKTDSPMSFQEAKSFVQALAKKWLASVRGKSS